MVPNDDFYRIDTALVSPRVSVEGWAVTVSGMVDREVSLTYADLSAMPLFDQFVTIACVSNEVGGRLVGNALWTGVDLRDVLDMAGVQPGADQIVGRSVDGFTAGFPTAWAMDPERRPMIALGMNGEPLPVDHGYPARLIIPGLYGYVSATKWLSGDRAHDPGCLRRLLGPAGLGEGGPHPHAVAHRRAPGGRQPRDRHDRRHRRCRLGAGPGGARGRGLDRRRGLAAGRAVGAAQRRDLGAMEARLAGPPAR